MDTKMSVSSALASGALTQEQHNDIMNALAVREASVELGNKLAAFNWLSLVTTIASFFPQIGPIIEAIKTLLSLLNINVKIDDSTDPKPN